MLPLFLAAGFLRAQEDKSPDSATNLPADPFKNIKTSPKAKNYSMEVDRKRGSISIPAKEGKYQEGSHFANWNWTMNAKRWGRYYVQLRYTSMLPKLGVQVKVGDSVVKSYAPRTGGHEEHKEHSLVMGLVYIDKPGEYPVGLLTGDKSNGPSFFLKAIEFIPAPEGDDVGQGIDGTIELLAKTAKTYSEMMRYEPKTEKNCLGFWVHEDDWAEWEFDVTSPGKFKIEVFQGCGGKNGGSEVAVLINDKTIKFEVEDTGGFQNWKSRDLGTVDLAVSGENRIAIKPLNKTGKAVMDIQKIVLTPVEG